MSHMLSRQSWFRKWSPAIILLKNTGDTAAPSTHWPHTCRTATRQTCSNVGPCAIASAGLITQFCHAGVGTSLQQARNGATSEVFLRKVPALQIPHGTRVGRASTCHLYPHYHPPALQIVGYIPVHFPAWFLESCL